ncbi:MAG: DNA polymerase III subunit beta [Prevotellaceae bacterium]|jgi:DNA polymerase-3 subunit beta|nr:DNA polymerase III subunit beta [Prevotellaceae bacterium]
MNLTFSRKDLLNRMNSVGSAINAKTPVPLLENYLFKIEEGLLTILATDLETTITTTMPIEYKGAKFSLAVPKKLQEMLNALPEQALILEIDETNLEITLKAVVGNYNGKCSGLDVGKDGEEFPKPKDLEELHHSFELPCSVLVNSIARTKFAAATEEARPAMTGILFDIFTDKLTFVATDAHKLVKYSILNQKYEFEDSFILPKKPADYLLKVVPNSDEDLVKISFDDKNIHFDLPEYSVKCRRIEGRFPNYNAVIQQNNPFKVIVDKDALINAVKAVKVSANAGTGLLKVKLTENQIELSSQDLDFSTAAEQSIVCQYSGDELEIGFKAALLEDILSNIRCSQVQIELADASKAGIIVPFENEENEDLLMLLMPMFLN